MLNLNVRHKDGLRKEDPDIFRAAAEDDVGEMARALNDGQSLDQFDAGNSTTPLHIACANRSRNFLRAALEHTFNPWVRDRNGRLAIDHAVANGITDVQEALFHRMYPDERVGDNLVAFPEPM